MTAPVPGEGDVAIKKKKKKASDSSGNVRVVSRIRPLAKYELEKGCEPVVSKVPVFDDNDGPESIQINEGEKRWFELDAVLDQGCTQQEVYEKSGAYKAISEDLFSGFNCTILAYGQTGAGKTFTMGTAAKNVGEIGEFDGVIPRAVKDLFDNIKIKCDSNAHVELSYMEVYNEEIRDLMCNDPAANANQLRIRETLNGEVYVRGLSARTVSNPGEIGKLMDEASGRRVVASTKMNATSSRSHAICVLKVKGVLEDSSKFQSKLTLVDLAGSERIKKTEAKGSRAQEGISINKGLFVLGQVVSALAEQRPKFKRKPPFRDSKLTRLLQDSLGGNSRTIMVACCSPADFNLEETINTLRYATQARNIKNTATANVIQTISQEEAMKLKRENQLLKQQVAEMEETIRRMTLEVTEEDLNRSRALIVAEQRKSLAVSHTSSLPSSVGIPSTNPLPPTQEVEFSSNLMGGGVDVSRRSSLASGAPTETTNSNQQTETANPNQQTDEDSIDVKDIVQGIGSVFSGGTTKTYQELEEENHALHDKLKQAQGDIRATVAESAIELPALKVRVMMLEEELMESSMLEAETQQLREELEEANSDRDAAQSAARQLADFMEKQKMETGFRGDELDKKRMWYFSQRLDENWVHFVVTILASFKEQMRLLGDYFEMVVTVVESPDILTMLGPQAQQKQANWWSNFGIGQNDETLVAEEKELRHRLLGEHIKFFNARLVEIEDEINSRSESVDAILDGLCYERQEMESELQETEFVRDLFNKKGEKLLSHLTDLMTGPLFSLPLMQADGDEVM